MTITTMPQGRGRDQHADAGLGCPAGIILLVSKHRPCLTAGAVAGVAFTPEGISFFCLIDCCVADPARIPKPPPSILLVRLLLPKV